MALRLIVSILLCVSFALGTSAAGFAADYPVRPVKIIVPYPPGGGNDIIGRVVAERLTKKFGQQVLVENRGGASTIIGTEAAKRAAADGYTILLATVTTLAVNPNLKKKLPYDTFRDFDPVTMLASQPYLLVVYPKVPVKSVKDLIAYAKAKPGVLNFGSPGADSNGRLAGELLKSLASIDIVHIAYKGTGPALTALLGGHIQLMFATMPSVHSYVENGQLHALAVSTAKRSDAMPNMPTVAEAGVPGYEMRSWNGLLVPKGVSPAIIKKINGAVNEVLNEPQVKQRLSALGFEPEPTTPEAFGSFIRQQMKHYAEIIKNAGIKPE